MDSRIGRCSQPSHGIHRTESTDQYKEYKISTECTYKLSTESTSSVQSVQHERDEGADSRAEG